MSVSSRWFTRLLSCALLLALPSLAAAQNGRITGTVRDSLARALSQAQVSVVGTAYSGSTNEAGRFTIAGVRPGLYVVEVRRIGSRARRIVDVRVRENEETALEVTLGGVSVELAPLVVSASRRAEKVTEAPATLTRIEATAIENTVGNSFSGALKGVMGLDFIQVGVTSAAVNARGFNSSFNNRMLMMEDNRVAVLPENGLPVGAFTAIPKIDLAAAEVLVGPGSALYGPDASNGVVTLTTRDPREYPGTTIEASSGSRSYVDVQARHASTFGGRWGFKIMGEYQAANDWRNQNQYAPVPPATTASPELNADFNTDVIRGAGALVYYFPTSGRLEFNAGMSRSNGLGQTNVGRNQLIDWTYGHAQLKFSNNNWFAQAYRTQSRSGETYQLNGFAQNRLRFPALSDDSIRALSDFPAEGDLTAAEIQHNFSLPSFLGARITWGAQYRHDRVSSKRQWLVDRQTGEDLTQNQIGGYGQVEFQLSRAFRLVASGRYDEHDAYDGQFSPKAAVLFSPADDQTFRVSYNRAFKSPTVLQTSFFFPDFQPFVGVFGNRNGFEIRNGAGTVVRTIAPIEPEINNTWELGYKGILGRRLYLDATAYQSRFEHFMSPLVIIANFATPAAAGGPTFAFDAVTGAAITGSTGGPQIPLTYFNVGNAEVHGFDVGTRYLLGSSVSLAGTMSWQKLDKVESAATDPAEATAFNSPMLKINLGIDADRFLTSRLSAGLNVRGVDGYQFRSGINVGYVPGFVSTDLQFGYDLPRYRARLNLSVQNLFTCRSGTAAVNGWLAATRPALFTETNDCGFGKRHIEMINAPEIGTMVFMGVRFQL